MSRNILQLNYLELKDFLLKNESYCNSDLPPYFDYEPLLKALSSELTLKNFHSIKSSNPSLIDDINYKIISNKNGKYDWRPLELINPILYVSLVEEFSNYRYWKELKKRFGKFRSISVVECMSLPVMSETNKSDKAEQIAFWWENIEQTSIELSLEYDYIYHTDISNCYSSIYTHSIQWAIHTKNKAKSKSFRKSSVKAIGKTVDLHLQSMSYGQTNGIPQGSVITDFIAEIVLHYADYLLSKRLKLLDLNGFRILRYRDDYRIFTNNTQSAHVILKELTDVLSDLGLKLNSSKTDHCNNVVLGSLKKDKIDWLFYDKSSKTIQKSLIRLHKFSVNHPNSGTLMTELTNIHKNIRKESVQKRIKKNENVNVLIAIVADIAFLNPKTYSVSMAIISVLLQFIEDADKEKILSKILTKFSKIPNIGFVQIWLQRSVIKYDSINIETNEPLTKLVNGDKEQIWNTDWVNAKVKKIVEANPIVNTKIIDELDTVIASEEVSLFSYK